MKSLLCKLSVSFLFPNRSNGWGVQIRRIGHLRQCRQAKKRVVLAVMAIWEDGSQELIHYEVAEMESEAA